MLNKTFPLILLAVMAVGLTACSSSDKEEDKPQVEKPVEQLYNDAAKALDAKNYKEATRLFEEVERQHPYSQWATKAQIMAAYAAYEGDNYDDAILALDRFIELHPGSEDIDYAYYLKALAYYEQISDVARSGHYASGAGGIQHAGSTVPGQQVRPRREVENGPDL